MSVTSLVKPASNLAYDALSKLTAPKINNRLLIVNIDDESVNRIGRWPWTRDVHAKALAQMNKAGVKAIIYDVLFTEAGDTAGDTQFAQQVSQARRIVLPFAYEIPGRNGLPVSAKLPLPDLIQAHALVGQAGAPVDNDGISRRITLLSKTEGTLYTHVVPLALDQRVSANQVEPLIAYAPHGSTPTVPFSAVVNGEIPAELLEDKIILVGATAAGLGDRFATPVSSDAALTSGVEVLANVASNMLDDRFITDSGVAGSLAMLALALTALAICFLRFEPRITIFVAIGLVVLMAAISLIGLRFGLWLDPAPSILALMLLFPAWGWQRLSTANRLIGRQLVLLRDDVGILDRATNDQQALDRVSSQLAALETGIERSIDLRRFIQSSFDSLPDPALVVREGGLIALTNTEAQRAFYQYCGMTIPDQAAQAFEAILPHIVGNKDQLLRQVQKIEREPFEITFDDDRHYQVSIGHFRNATAENFAIIRLGDVTALRRAEHQRQNALEFLSHDLRSPQSSMISLIDGHGSDIEKSLADRLRALATRTLQLAQSFVDISRVQAGSYSVTEIDLHDSIQEALDSLWPDLKAKAIKTKVTAPEEEALVDADQLLLLRAVTNLIHNAVKFSPASGQIAVTIRARTRSDGKAGWACLIDDQGPGVAREDQMRIFERFQSGSRAMGGVGLGLSLAAAVAKEFGGTVRCVSHQKIGTRFVLWLPRSETEQVNEAEPAPILP